MKCKTRENEIKAKKVKCKVDVVVVVRSKILLFCDSL